MEYAERCNTIRKRMKDEIRQYNMTKIKQTTQEHKRLNRAKQKLTVGKSHIITLKSSLNDRDEIISRGEELYQDLYSSKKTLPKPDINIDEDEVPDITRGQKGPERYEERQS